MAAGPADLPSQCGRYRWRADRAIRRCCEHWLEIGHSGGPWCPPIVQPRFRNRWPTMRQPTQVPAVQAESPAHGRSDAPRMRPLSVPPNDRNHSRESVVPVVPQNGFARHRRGVGIFNVPQWTNAGVGKADVRGTHVRGRENTVYRPQQVIDLICAGRCVGRIFTIGDFGSAHEQLFIPRDDEDPAAIGCPCI